MHIAPVDHTNMDVLHSTHLGVSVGRLHLYDAAADGEILFDRHVVDGVRWEERRVLVTQHLHRQRAGGGAALGGRAAVHQPHLKLNTAGGVRRRQAASGGVRRRQEASGGVRWRQAVLVPHTHTHTVFGPSHNHSYSHIIQAITSLLTLLQLTNVRVLEKETSNFCQFSPIISGRGGQF